MARRRKVTVVAVPDGWTIYDTAKVNGRILTKGTECSIRGERGRFRFQRRVVTDKAEWLDFIGGARFRSFYPERVKRVHRIDRTRQNLTAA
jgi:hypothetical protein